MPSKNIVKEYKDEAYYHVYNRGVNKGTIFSNTKDYKKFLGYLKFYLTKLDLRGQTSQVAPTKRLKNYADNVKLLAYCLMPNHFHLLIYQTDLLAMAEFMQSLCTKYSIYFNRTNKRCGPLFQGRYKAVEVAYETQLIYLTKYIHRNPLDILPARTDLAGYKYSSYGNYLRKFNQSWIQTDDVLEYFKKSSYQEFVEESDDRDIQTIKEVVIDIDA
jgi:putative transposase